jgi:putative FmdB family regulatory protein
MPIYAYKCGSCGHAKDVLQKLSDAPLTVCPSCGAAAFGKQLTAAGFQLKGSGWYATDFKNGSKPAPAPGTEGAKTADGAAPANGAKTGEGSKPADGASKPAQSTPAATKTDTPSAFAGRCGGPCA